jgi:hypothetical protein
MPAPAGVGAAELIDQVVTEDSAAPGGEASHRAVLPDALGVEDVGDGVVDEVAAELPPDSGGEATGGAAGVRDEVGGGALADVIRRVRLGDQAGQGASAASSR